MRRFHWTAVAPFLKLGPRDLAWAFVVAALALAYCVARRSGPADTGRELDLAILGKGYFVVKHESTGLNGYVRNGRISLDGCGRMIVGRPIDGWVIQPQITFPGDYQEIHIAQDGTVAYGQAGNEQLQQAGRLQLATFVAPEHLKEVAPGVVQATQDSGCAHIMNPGQAGAGLIQQGRLESPPLLSRFDWPDLWSWTVVGLAIFAIREVRKLREEVRRSRDLSYQMLSTRYIDATFPTRKESPIPEITTVAASAGDR